MKPAHLQRHLKTKHPSYVGKEPEFFKRKLSDSTASAKSLEASYAVSLLIAKAKKPFTKGEDLLLPAAVVLAEMMLDKNAAEKFKTVPLVDKMGTDLVDQVVAKLGNSFSLQLDESTDVSGCTTCCFCEIRRY
ncbi:Zinc finger MYM-type protein 6 [Merluccius polli]|uniref:Zinc finger MYM-type protein 6 n=1 Tax=Merluccius polli TaxID=89951 RepID=A0AA47N6V1_MERPO|nr:Zinc finger MYM-type protein 6 [Merluccius polli]